MQYDKELIAHKLDRWDRFITDYHLPEWDSIPDLGLYMDQVVVLLVIAAIITPPDIFSLILVIIPLYWLYELSIRLSSRIERRDAADGAVAAAVISATSDEN